tara:strand:- start:329 stop:586 length:258 start_codon:yes stop_codon:yes gene_type:complete
MYTCSLTGKSLINPVKDNNNYYYEHIEIIRWLTYNNISPNTGELLYITDLQTDFNLKKKIKVKHIYFPYISRFLNFLKLNGKFFK